MRRIPLAELRPAIYYTQRQYLCILWFKGINNGLTIIIYNTNMLFNPQGRSIQFRLIDLDAQESTEIKKLIKQHGGVVSDKSRFIFTNNKTYTGDKDVFDVNYIRECVRLDQLLDLIDFKIGRKGLYGCLMSYFIIGSRYCSCKVFSHLNNTETQMLKNPERVNITGYEHDYVNIESTDESQSNEKHNYDSSNEATDSMYHPDDTQLSDNPRSQSNDTEHDVRVTNSMIGISKEKRQDSAAKNSHIETSSFELGNNGENHFSNISAIYPLSAAEEEAEVELDENNDNPKNSTDQAANLSNNCLQKVQILSSTLLSASESQKFCLEKLKKKTSRIENREEQINTGPLKAGDTTSVLGENINKIRVIDDGIMDSMRDTTDFMNSSTDSDATNCDQLSPNRRRYSARKKMEVECEEISNGLNTCAEKDCPNKEQPGPSRVRHISVSSTNDSSTSDSIISVTSGSEIPVRRKRRSGTVLTLKNVSKLSNDEKNAVVSSTRLSERDSSSCDTVWSDIEMSEITNKTSRSNKPPKTENKLSESNTKKKRILLSRNFLPWEQKEMVKYLITSNSISEAKGNNVWKQMIDDGYLAHRTFQSLNNHFRRTILPNIDRFKMDSKSRAEFEQLRN